MFHSLFWRLLSFVPPFFERLLQNPVALKTENLIGMRPYSISSCFTLALITFSDKLHYPLLSPNLFLLSFPFARPNKPCCYLLSCSWRAAHSTAQHGHLCCGLFQLGLQLQAQQKVQRIKSITLITENSRQWLLFLNVFVPVSELMFHIIEGIVSTRSYS